MSQFILTKEQHLAFKAAWKNFLKTEAKEVKKKVRSGQYYRGYSNAFHILRHILISDVQHIEQKIVKAYASQKNSAWDGNAARAGLTEISSYFSVKRKSYLAGRYTSFKDFLAELTDEQLEQINKIATEIHSRYTSGAIK